jgi:hypothetical protein
MEKIAFVKYNYNDPAKEDEMGSACGIHVREVA